MSENIESNPKTESSFWLQPHQAKTCLAIAASLVGIVVIHFDVLIPIWFVMTLVGLLIAFWGQRVWAVYALVGIVLIVKMANVNLLSPGRMSILTGGDLVFTTLLMLFAGLSFRFFEIHRLTSSVYQMTISRSGSIPTKRPVWRFPSVFGGRWWFIPISMGAAYFLLKLFPFDASTRREYWILPEPARVIFLLGSLFLIWFIGRSIILLATRWMMTPEQADMICRGEFARQHWREHRGIESRRAKMKSKEVSLKDG